MSVAFSFVLTFLRLDQRTSNLDFYTSHWRFPTTLRWPEWRLETLLIPFRLIRFRILRGKRFLPLVRLWRLSG